MLLLSGIADLREDRRRRGFRTTLHKIRAHSNIRGNDLAYVAAKMAITQYESLPESQKLKVDVGEISPRPLHWVIMYTVRAMPPPTRLGADTWMATLHQPRWYISEGERLQMHAFMRTSQQIRRKFRHALLRSLHYTSLYRRLVQQNIEVGTNTHSVGKAIHRRLVASAWEGSTRLKFLYGQLYNGKLAKRYGNAPIDDCPLCHKPDSCTHIAGE